jgi:hypothetical protein
MLEVTPDSEDTRFAFTICVSACKICMRIDRLCPGPKTYACVILAGTVKGYQAGFTGRYEIRS